MGLKLPFLACAGGRYELAFDSNRRTRTEDLDRLIIAEEVRLDDDLEVLKARAVIELNKTELLGIPAGAHPAFHQDPLCRSGRMDEKIDHLTAFYHRRTLTFSEELIET